MIKISSPLSLCVYVCIKVYVHAYEFALYLLPDVVIH